VVGAACLALRPRSPERRALRPVDSPERRTSGCATRSVGADSDDADVVGGAGGRGRKCCAPTIPIMVPAFSAVTSRQFGGRHQRRPW
jgi:hypothetical protein